MTPEHRSVGAILAELASCRLARVADRLLTGEVQAAADLLADARRAMAQLEAAMGAEAEHGRGS